MGERLGPAANKGIYGALCHFLDGLVDRRHRGVGEPGSISAIKADERDIVWDRYLALLQRLEGPDPDHV